MKDYFLLSRPYTIVEVILIGMLANVIAVGGLYFNNDLLVDVFVSLCFWLSFLLLTENRKGRKISIYVSGALLMLLIATILLKNPASIMFVVLGLLFLYAYSQKSNNPVLGVISPVMRGCLALVVFFNVLSFHDTITENVLIDNYPIILALFLSTTARNLVGDIRDYKVDNYTFPKRYGRGNSFIVSEMLIVLSCLLIGDMLVAFPLILILLVILSHMRAYLTHRMHILASTFFLMNYIMFLIDIPVIFNDILFIAVMLNFTYDHVPRTITNSDSLEYK